MEEINSKKHPPWYARGTPVTNTRDGPAMALSNTPLIVIRRKSSASGVEGEKGRGKGEGEEKGKGLGRAGGNPPLADVKTNRFQHAKTTCTAIGMRCWKPSPADFKFSW